MLFGFVAQSQTIIKMEYFFDADPGVGSGTEISFTSGSTVDFDTQISISGLSVGHHVLFIRMQDSDGKWSLYEGRNFYISETPTQTPAQNITEMEYFIGTDPGAGNGTPVTLTKDGEVNMNIPLDMTGQAVGDYNISFRVRDDNGIWGIAETREFSIADCTQPIPSYSYSTGCVNTPTDFTDLSTNADAGATYSWDVDGDGVEDYNTVGDISHTYTSEGEYNVSLTIVNDGGCNYTFSEIVIINEDITDPEITSTHNTQQVDADANCEVSLPDYTGDVTATDDCDNDLDITQSPTASSIISETTEITLTVTDDAGNFVEVTFNVEVADNTVPTITCIENQSKQLFEGETAYTVSGTEFDPTESSDNCDFTVINDFNSSATLENANFPIGSTTVIWTITDNAGNPANCNFDIQVNAFVNIETLQQNGISIYPNPTNGILNFEFANNNIQKLSISDITGKTIIERTEIQQNEMIDLSNFENGIYIIKIQTDNEIFTTKIVKE